MDHSSLALFSTLLILSASAQAQIPSLQGTNKETMTATTILKVEDLSLSQVKAIPASSAEAQPLIAHYVSEMNGELWSRLRPLSVVVVNSTDRSIVGYSVQWEFALLDGKKQTRGYHYGQPDAVLDNGRTKIPPEHRVNARMIEPLASQLVFPLPQISHPTQLSPGHFGVL